MKSFFFKCALLFAVLPVTPLSASLEHMRPLFLISHWRNERIALVLREELAQEISVSASAIEIEETFNPCKEKFFALVHLCVLEGESTFHVKRLDRKLLRIAFSHFKQ